MRSVERTARRSRVGGGGDGSIDATAMDERRGGRAGTATASRGVVISESDAVLAVASVADGES